MKFSSSLPRWLSIPLVGSILSLTSCSAAKPPVAPIAQAELAVEQASQSKASVYAPAALQMAREKMMNAERSMAAKEYTDARYFAEQAIVDAQFAQAKGNASEAQQQEAEVRKTMDALRSEATQSTTQP